MRIEIIRVDGARETVDVAGRSKIADAIGAGDGCDTVNLRDGRFMYVDDLGHQKGKPVNREATRLYRAVCRPGTTHAIVGDVAIVTGD